MLVVVLMSVLLVACLPVLVWTLRRGGPGDLAARVVAVSVTRLPARRRSWGKAMTAELGEVQGRARRWRFAAGVLRVVLFPPSLHRGRVLAAAVAGPVVVGVGTAAAATEVPAMTVFAAVLGLVLSGCATVAAARDRWPAWTLPSLLTALVALAGVGVTIADVTVIAVTHPAAEADPTHVYSVLLAFVLAFCLAVPLTPRRGEQQATVLWRALAATLIAGVAAAATSVGTGGEAGPWLLVVAVVTLAASAGAARSTRDRAAGARAGTLTVLLSQPVWFAIGMTVILARHHYVLTSSYDVTAYARSGFHDVASYLLSDALGGFILAGLLIYPCLLLALAQLGAVMGASSRRRVAESLLPPAS